MSILINSTLDTVRNEFALKAPVWTFGHEINQKERTYLRKECTTESEFDPQNRRKTMYQNMMDGTSTMIKGVCPYGSVIAILENQKQMEEIPWELWGRIMRLYSEQGQLPFIVFFLANTHLRTFPSGHRPITPMNINGGYTYPCNRQTIVIYRAEDATRVLLHELMHSCCMDNHKLGVDRVEAATEAWAEFLYIALLSQGKQKEFSKLLKLQSEWMIKQNAKVKEHMQQPDSMEFPWRYTIGKEDIWRKWNIVDESGAHLSIGNSLRLTYPPTSVIKERFHVRKSSTIL